jgi:hypothetical protein
MHPRASSASRVFLSTLVALAILAVVAILPCPAATLDVPAGYSRITDALTAADPGDTVLVSGGLYSPSQNAESFPLLLGVADVSLLGGGMGISILDAGSTGSVIEISATGVRVSGFTLTRGLTTDGGGIHVISGDPEIDHCLITDNYASTLGSGIHAAAGATPWIHHNVVWENWDTDIPSGGDPHGIQLRNANGLVEHNVIGRGDSNGLIVEQTAAPTIRNNIFYENGTPALRGRGICALGDPATVVAYNMFYGNVIAAIIMNTGSTLEDVSAAVANDVDGADGVYGNIDADPVFLDVDNGDWRLQPASPAIDAGDPTSPNDPDATRADIGVFYFNQNLVGIEDVMQIPFQFAPAFPNPFTHSAELRFSLSREADVSLKVFGVRGRLIADLARGRLPAGPHRRAWDGTDTGGKRVPLGIYFVLLEADGISAVQRVVFVP